MISLLDTIEATFSRELIGHVAARLGESQSGVGKALGGMVPAVLGGLIGKVGAGAAQTVFDASQQAYHVAQRRLGTVTGMLGLLGSGRALGSALRQGETLLTELFGDFRTTVAEPVRQYAGIKLQSASTLLSLVAATVPALLGGHATRHHLHTDGVAAVLINLKASVREMLPRSLHGLAGLELGPNAAPVVAFGATMGWGALACTGAYARSRSSLVAEALAWFVLGIGCVWGCATMAANPNRKPLTAKSATHSAPNGTFPAVEQRVRLAR